LPIFEYKGKTLAGTNVSGELKAKDRNELEKLLRSNRILVSSVIRKPSSIKFSFGRRRVKKVHISRFTRQFSTMIGAGLPMVQCLEILAQQSDSVELRKVIGQVKESVQSGTTLAEALSKHKKVFDDLYVNMVDAGEIGGALDSILLRLAVYREKADALVRKVRGALIYPAVILIVAIGATFLMLTFIVPVFAKMFAGVGAELPGPTKFVLGLSHFIRSNFLTGLILFVLLAIGFRYLSPNKPYILRVIFSGWGTKAIGCIGVGR